MISIVGLLCIILGVFTYDCNLPGEFSFNGYCYQESSSSGFWRTKENDCKALHSNAHMFSIHSLAENNFIRDTFNGDFYFGASQRLTPDYFFVDGTIMSFTNWATNHPEIAGDTYAYSCTSITVVQTTSALWYGSRCDVTKKTICKWPLDDSTSAWDDVTINSMTAPPFDLLGNGRPDFSCTNCPDNFSWRCIKPIASGGLGGHLYSPVDGQCWYLIEDNDEPFEKSWDECQAWHENSTFLTLSSFDQQMALTRHSSNMNGDAFWIGLTSLQHFGEFLWMGPGHTPASRGDYSYLSFSNTIPAYMGGCATVDFNSISNNPQFVPCDTSQNFPACSIRMDLNNPNEILKTSDYWNNVQVINGMIDNQIVCDYTTVKCPEDDNRFAWHCLNNGDYVYQGRCNEVHSLGTGWVNALSTCRGDSRNMFLGTLRDDNEAFILNNLGMNSFWLGLNDIYREGTFSWLDGELLGSYDKTNDKTYSNSNNCFYYDIATTNWITRRCEQGTYDYFCQYPICDPVSLCSESEWDHVDYLPAAGDGSGKVFCDYTTESCPSNYFTQWGGNHVAGTWECANAGGIPVNDKCITYNSGSGNFYYWEQYCRTTYGAGAHLLALPGDGEPYLSDIATYLHGASLPASNIYIGLNRIGDLSRWEFTTGDTYDDVSFPWQTVPSGTDRCVVLSPSQAGLGIDCSAVYAYAYCEFPLDHSVDEWDNVDYTLPNIITCPFLVEQCPDVYKYCFGYHYLDPNVCGGNGLYSYTNAEHGKCTSYNYCECNADYLPGTVVNNENNNCRHWNCNSKYHLNPDNGCADGKTCIDKDYCHCYNQFNGAVNCSIWTCDGILYTNHSHVCSGHGDCIFNDDLYNQKCKCQPGYHGKNCEIQKCHGIFSNHSKVCTGHGKCSDINKCECEKDYSENQCEFWECWGIDRGAAPVCWSKGRCVALDTCECPFLVSGHQCENDSTFIFVSAIAVSTLIVVCCIFAVIVVVVFIALKFTLWSGKGSKLSIKPIPKKKKKNASKDEVEEQIKLLEQQSEEEDAKAMASLVINKSLFIIDFKNIKLEGLIGSGGSDSQIFRGHWKDMDVAIKLYRTFDLSSSNNFTEFEREVQVLSQLNHPAVVTFFGCSLKPPRVGIVFEYCHGGDLINFYSIMKCEDEEVRKKYPFAPNAKLTMNMKIRFIDQISQAMRFLHLKNCYHRDLKSSNILVDKRMNAKLTDFGLSRFMLNQKNAKQKTQRIGTSHYMAPEVCLGKNYSEKCDVFSFGMMIYEILSENFNPFPKVHNVELKIANNPEFRPKIKVESKYEKWLIKLMKGCFNHEPQDRPSFSEVCRTIEMMWEKSDDGDGLESKKSDSKKKDPKELSKKVDRILQKIDKMKKRGGD